jgi:catechol 2,3-dioxygenase-like lactoylglutathione lyase family enzyme
MIRACAGRGTCLSAAAIAANDDACGSSGSSVSFACPAGGSYTILVGNHDSQQHASITPAAATGPFPLTYPVSGMDFIGATLFGVDAAGNEIEFLVNDIELDPESPSGDVLLYTLLFRDPNTGVWDNACEPDLDGVQSAIPMHGVWDDLGARHESDTLVTFGCVSGVLAKCIRWGYRPWTVNGRDLIPYHQACTRMARADYCGDGVSHTLDGTLIDIWDAIGIQQRTPGSGMLFEASWVESGAYCVSKWRWNIDGVALLLECPEKIAIPSLQDVLAGCLVKLATAGRSAIRTNNDSYVGISLP